eukprot:TRINITY_DN1852_c0_g1_i1.p1 TRINITY_DN1852_c0_g1~~TRINITY_DN1852_c0_g1_i1.p1  ORF type:complete len:667 (-),score=110.40 TRINITY_DN1852_c0_g1_i1:727-2727(-)
MNQGQDKDDPMMGQVEEDAPFLVQEPEQLQFVVQQPGPSRPPPSSPYINTDLIDMTQDDEDAEFAAPQYFTYYSQSSKLQNFQDPVRLKVREREPPALPYAGFEGMPPLPQPPPYEHEPPRYRRTRYSQRFGSGSAPFALGRVFSGNQQGQQQSASRDTGNRVQNNVVNNMQDTSVQAQAEMDLLDSPRVRRQNDLRRLAALEPDCSDFDRLLYGMEQAPVPQDENQRLNMNEDIQLPLNRLTESAENGSNAGGSNSGNTSYPFRRVDVQQFPRIVPSVGSGMCREAERFKRYAKSRRVPGMSGNRMMLHRQQQLQQQQQQHQQQQQQQASTTPVPLRDEMDMDIDAEMCFLGDIWFNNRPTQSQPLPPQQVQVQPQPPQIQPQPQPQPTNDRWVSFQPNLNNNSNSSNSNPANTRRLQQQMYAQQLDCLEEQQYLASLLHGGSVGRSRASTAEGGASPNDFMQQQLANRHRVHSQVGERLSQVMEQINMLRVQMDSDSRSQSRQRLLSMISRAMEDYGGPPEFGLPVNSGEMREMVRRARQAGISPDLLFSDRDFDSNDYEQLLRLDHFAENSHLGASTEQIDSVQLFNVSKQDLVQSGHLEGERCAICLEDFQVGETLRKMPCAHCFHKGCLDKWLEQKAVCPNCGKDFRESEKEKDAAEIEIL